MKIKDFGHFFISLIKTEISVCLSVCISVMSGTVHPLIMVITDN